MHTYRTALLNNNVTWCQCKRYLSDVQTQSHLLAKYFAMSPSRASKYINTNSLGKKNPELIAKSIDYCRTLGFADRSILKYSGLLRMHSLTLEHRHMVMEEGGFYNITPALLAKFRSHYKKSVALLKASHLIKQETNVAQSFISYISPRPDDFNINCNDEDSWAIIHRTVLQEYLKWRLQASDEDIDRLIRTHSPIKHKSFRVLCENIAIASDLGFTNEKIIKYGYLLHNYPKYTKQTLEKFPTLAGADMKKAMRTFPKLAITSPANIEKIYNILKAHDIPDDMIKKSMNVLHMSPETVEHRLEEIKRVSNFKVLLSHPNVLKLVVHQNRAKMRLSFLQKLQLKCLGLTVLGTDGDKFDVHVKEGRDINTLADTCAFLEGLFRKSRKDFYFFRRHPFYLQVPLLVMEDSYNFLIDMDFTSADIFQVAYIILYPREKLAEALGEVDRFKEEHRRELTQVEVLSLALYFMEKEHHFSGNGIWKKTEAALASN